jgi:uncharacterized protein
LSQNDTPSSMDMAVVTEVRRRLSEIVETERVSIPLAIESGSRAWGFPSPDSDYDCRFVYVRSFEKSLTLFPERDVIETPVTPVFDVSGWDLSKALKLMLKGNAVILEWLTSPFAYQADAEFRSALLSLSEQVVDRHLVGRHYYHLASSQIGRYLLHAENVPLKKLFYALRPLVALKWLDCNPGQTVAPMHFPELCLGANLPSKLESVIDELLAVKAATREMGEGPLPLPIADFLRSEFEKASPWGRSTQKPNPKAKDLTDNFWRTWLERLAPCLT